MIDTGTPHVLAEVDGSLGWITFSRPEQHNAMTGEMWAAIPAALSVLAADRYVRTIVLRGAGDRAFVAGADISEFEEHRGDPESARTYETGIELALDAIRAVRFPVIAMIQGYCIGGGLSIALAADMRIASFDAEFGIPAARLGLAYPKHTIGDLVAVAGVPLAKDMLFTARRLGAEEARARGLVSRIVLKDRLVEETREMAGQMALNAPLTLTSAKASVNFIAQGFGEETDIDRLESLCFGSEDFAEGRAAFAAKRPPEFKGR